MLRRVLCVTLLLSLGLLAACGQKGDLVLPTKPAASSATVAAPAPASTAAKPAAGTAPATSSGSG